MEKHYINKWYNGHSLYRMVDPYDLPPYTVRLLYEDDFTPTFRVGSGVQISEYPNIWNFTYDNTDWTDAITAHFHLLSVQGGNLKGVKNLFNSFVNNDKLSSFSVTTSPELTSTNNMMSNCYKLQDFRLTDTSNVKYMGGMFTHCSSMSSSPIFNTNNVKAMNGMFYGCSNLTYVQHYNTSEVTSTSDMFEGCTKLESVPLFDLSNNKTMYHMFWSCRSLTSIQPFETSSLTSLNAAFAYCVNVCSGISSFYNLVNSRPNNPYHGQTFRGCGVSSTQGAAELALIPSDWK